VLLCLGLACTPLSLRAKARELLLEGHGRLHSLLLEDLDEAQGAGAQGNELALLEAEVRELQRALREANAAQELVARDPGVELIPAEVLPLAGNADLVHRVALARGARDGVRPGLPVLSEGVLVGRVASVAPSTCEVRLVTDPRFRIRVTVAQGKRNVEGLLSGDGGSVLNLRPAVLDERAAAPDLRRGASVLTSRASLLCGVPALVGVIEGTSRPPGSPQDHAQVRPACDLTRLRRVVIVRGQNPKRS